MDRQLAELTQMLPDELTEDRKLALAIERGEISKEEVARIWGQTEDLPATTPIETRKAVIAIRAAGRGHDPIEAMALAYPHFMRFVMDSVARTEHALTIENSTWAHLVAGTESIVKSMQNVGVLEKRLQAIEGGLYELREACGELKRMIATNVPKATNGYVVEAPPIVDEAAATAEPTIDEEQEADAARKRTIGSAWAK
jgi:hypothetical protein